MTAPTDPNALASRMPKQFLDSDGKAVAQIPAIAGDITALMAGYRALVRARIFDEKAIALQRTGRLGTYASCLGQEAVGVGIAQMMAEDDVFLPSFREQAAQLVRGVSMTELLLLWGGDERGNNFAKARQDFPITIPVASHFPHAVGVALAMKLRGENRAAVAVAGDGATSKGDFYEALNMAGVWKVPAIFAITNNQWAISVRRQDQTAAQTLAQKAVAAGVPGERVDGNDLIAVREVMRNALDYARAGHGAILIEFETYRLADHTTADDASRYRDPEEVAPHWKDEPVKRLRSYLVAEGVWTKEAEHGLIEACRQDAERAAEEYMSRPAEAPEAMFDYLYETLPVPLRNQRQQTVRQVGVSDA